MSATGFTPIQLYYSTTAAAAPSAGNLAAGELAVNITDGKLFYKDNGGVVRVLATAAGSAGDVVGPGSSTDNALVRFDGTTGKLVQSSVGVLSDAGVLTGLTGLTSSGSITFSGLTSGRVTYAGTGGLLQDSANLTFDGTTLTANALTVSNAVTLSGGTANGVAYLNASKELTTGSALTFDGTRLTSTTGKFGSGAASNSASLMVNNATNTATGIQLFQDGIESWIMGMPANSAGLAWSASGSEQMRLTSTGLGIGTSSPTFKLDVQGTSGLGFRLMETSTGNNNRITISQSGTETIYNASYSTGSASQVWQIGTAEQMRLTSTGLGIGTSSPTEALTITNDNTYKLSLKRTADGSYAAFGATGNSLLIYNNGAERMRLDSSGNLGLGVTPSAWVTLKPLEIAGLGNAISGFPSDAGIYVTSNAYYGSAGWRYGQSGKLATRYSGESGIHSWSVAPSGTAGNAISFTQAMTLTASAELNIDSGTGGGRLTFSPGSSSNNLLSTTTGFSAYNALRVIASDIRFETGSSPSERARIDSNGNLLVGTTSDGAGIGAPSRLAVRVTNGYAAILRGQQSGNAIVTAWNSSTAGDGVFHEFGTETSYTVRGTISFNRTAGLTAYNTTSDYRAKDIIGPVADSGALIDSVPVYMGKMKGATQERPMFIAHETPSYAHTGEKDAVDKDGKPVFQQMDASALVPVMWAELQSLRARVAELEAA